MHLEKIRIMLVHHGELFREGMATILEREHRFAIVFKCKSLKEAIENISQLQPDVILLDASDLGNSHAEIRHIAKLAPKTKIIVLALPWKNKVSLDMIDAGAHAFISKDIDVEDVIRSILIVQAGGLVVFPPLAQDLIAVLKHKPAELAVQPEANYAVLTEREKQILNMTAQGKTNREISEALGISEHTVKGYMARVLAKLRVHNRQQAISVTAGKANRPQP
jgi:DNA-binding NarL/FixJ family response regulator